MRERTWPVLGAAVLMVVVTVACVNDATYSGTTGPKVAVIGDDVVSASATTLHTTLDPQMQLRIAGLDGFSSSQLVGTAADYATSAPSVVVLEAGTRDAMSGLDPTVANANIATMRRAFGSACMVAVNVSTHVSAPSFDAARARTINTALRSSFDHVIDWDAAVAADPDGLTDATNHLRPTAAGQDALTAMVATAVSRCGLHPVRRSVPLAGGRNFLGTMNMLSGGLGGRGPFGASSAQDENAFLSVSGYCARNEHGDLIAPRADANQVSGTGSCAPAGSAPRPNPFWTSANGIDSDGYYYSVDVATAGTYTIDAFDAANCQFEGSMGGGVGADSGADTANAARTYHFTVLNDDSNNPLNASVQSTTAIAPAQCATYANKWVSFTLTAFTPGTYFMRVSPDTPPATTSTEGQNQFALTVEPAGSAFAPCTNDPTTAIAGVVTYAPTCPRLAAVSDLGLYVATPPGRPTYALASIGPERAGSTLNVELFDFAEGSTGVELLDPNGNPVTFTAEVACKDGTYISELGPCTTGEQAPSINSLNAPVDPGGSASSGPWTRAALDVCGGSPLSCTGMQPWSSGLTQNTLYSDRLIRLQYRLPGDYGATSCPDPVGSPQTCRTMWRVRVSSGNSGGDRTTWRASITGDPVLPGAGA